MADKTRVLCVDDHAFLVDGLRVRIEAEPDLEFAGRIGSADRLVEAARTQQADIVLLDIEMPGLDPFDALRDLCQVCPRVRAIMFSAYVRDKYIESAYQAGAWGYLCKSDPPEFIIESIRDVIAGRIASSPEVLQRVLDNGSGGEGEPVRSRLDAITRREHQILRMIAKGMTRTAIASEISRSPATVDNHRKSIMKKLHLSDRGELIRYAIAEGLVEV